MILKNWIRKSIFYAILRILPLTLPATAADAALLFGIKAFVNLIDKNSDWSIGEWALAMATVSFLRFFFLKFRGNVAENIFRKTGAVLQARFLRTLKTLHPRFFHRQSADAELRAAFEATEILPRSGESVVQALQAFSQLVFFLPILFYLSWQLTLLLFFAVLPLILLIERKLRAMAPAEESAFVSEGVLRSDLEKNRDLYRFWSHPTEKQQTDSETLAEIRTLYHTEKRLAEKKLSLSLSIETVSVLAMIAVLSACAFLISKNLLEVSDLVLYSSAVFLCYKPIKECARALPQIRAAATAYQLLVQLETFPKKSRCKNFDKNLVVHAGFFGYGQTNVFADFEFSADFHKSQFIFLHGENGAGKSTLLRLIAGLEEWDAGKFYLPQEIRSHGVFFLSQNLFLPPASFFEKLLNKNFQIWPEHKKNAVLQFMEKAGVSQLAKKSGRSGGEQARLGLAWALVSDAPLLLLDEPLAYISRFEKDSVLEAFLNAAEVLEKFAIFSGHEELPPELAKRFCYVKISKNDFKK